MQLLYEGDKLSNNNTLTRVGAGYIFVNERCFLHIRFVKKSFRGKLTQNTFQDVSTQYVGRGLLMKQPLMLNK